MHKMWPRLALADDLVMCGRTAQLEPLQLEHHDDLCRAAADGELWKLTCTSVPDHEQMLAYIKEALEQRAANKQFPFVVRRLADNTIVGSTRYYYLQPEHRNLSIGFTWYSKSAQRTPINTECKLMLLSYAFETLNCIGVAFHVDDTNLVSQAAVKRLGAVKEGVLRNDKIMPDGRVRDTFCYSITDDEWSGIKKILKGRLRQSNSY